MKSVQSLINGLEAWTQEELLARRRMLALLEEQEAAVKRAHGEDLARSVDAIDAELQTQLRRDERRAKLFEGLGSHWKVAPGALTVSSICERAGPASARLVVLRDELAEAGDRVVRKNRRVAALLNAHQKVIGELLGALIAIQGGAPGSGPGRLVDAEA